MKTILRRGYGYEETLGKVPGAVLRNMSMLRDHLLTMAYRHIGGREGVDFSFRQNNHGCLVPIYIAGIGSANDGDTITIE